MTLTELLPTIQALPRADKLRLIQLLAADVAREDGIALVVSVSALVDSGSTLNVLSCRAH